MILPTTLSTMATGGPQVGVGFGGLTTIAGDRCTRAAACGCTSFEAGRGKGLETLSEVLACTTVRLDKLMSAAKAAVLAMIDFRISTSSSNDRIAADYARNVFSRTICKQFSYKRMGTWIVRFFDTRSYG